MNVTKAELFEMIIDLRNRLDALTGAPRGPISMTEARIAGERGDKVTLQRYENQFKDPAFLALWIAEASRKGRFATGGEAKPVEGKEN